MMTDKQTDSGYAQASSKRSPRELIQGQLSLGKLAFLGSISVVLSLFGPLSLLAPVPLTIAFLLYGKQKVALMGVGISAVLWGISLGFGFVSELAAAAMIFTVALAYGFLIFNFVEKKEHPIAGLLKSGAIILTFWAVAFLGISALTGFALESKLVEAVSERLEMFKTEERYAVQYQALKNSATVEAKLFLDSLEKPEGLVKSVLRWLPGGIFAGTFLSLWICQFMVFRNSLIWRQLWSYPYGLNDLLRFRVPDFFIYPLILGLALVLGSEYMEFPIGEIIGGNILVCLAVFYFFQGFGIVMDGLTYFKILGLMRSLFLMLVLILAWRVVIFVGLFDTWINFRKYFKKKIDEGENG